MEIVHIRYDEYNKIEDEYVAAIGNFDGFHIAHRKLLDKAYEISKEKLLKLAIITFDLPPKQVVSDIENYTILKNAKQKKDILDHYEIDTVFLIHFNKHFQNFSKEEFIEHVITSNNIKYLVCGFDFGFGYQKDGDVNYLLKQKDFNTIVVDEIKYQDEKIGTSLINELIMNGEIEQANNLLTTPYSIIGNVVSGNQKGRTIGFPTANLKLSANYRIPQPGVYATMIKYHNQMYYGMTNIGHNPTFNFAMNATIETNIFSFNKDIYDEEIEIFFYKYIRKEKIFDNVDLLIEQLNRDKQDIKEYFKTK